MKRSIKHRKKVTVFGILLLFLIIFIVYSRLAIVNEVSCTTQYGACDSTTLNDLNKFSESNYFSFKKKASTYLLENKGVSMVRFHYIPFNRVEVFFIQESADYALKITNLNKYMLISSSGKVLSIQDATALPYLSVDMEGVDVGQSIDDSKKSGLELLNVLYKSYGIRHGEFSSGSVVAVFPQGVKVIFPVDENIDLLMGKLQFILSQIEENLNDNKIKISEVDLRYENPIIR